MDILRALFGGLTILVLGYLALRLLYWFLSPTKKELEKAEHKHS